MDFQKIHPGAPFRNYIFIKNCMIRLAQITSLEKNPYLIEHINQTDENLFPKDTAYAILDNS